jgi:hypothetical protein
MSRGRRAKQFAVPRRARAAHDMWMRAQDDTRTAYRWWMLAPIAQRAEAYAVHLAARDREDAARRAFERAVA